MKNINQSMRMGLTLAALAAGSILCAQSGKTITNHDGTCQATAPAGWNVTGGTATSPDGGSHINVSATSRPTTFDALKKTAPALFPNDKITKNSATEFEMESTAAPANVYRAIPAAASGKFCIAQVDFTVGVSDARKMAETLKATK
jgi:hypothetical protein